MGKLIYIEEGRRRIAARKGFDPWGRRFGTFFDENTSIRGLEDPVIKYLANGKEGSSAAFYDFIMGIKGLGHAPHFHHLDSKSKMGLTNVTIFLLDLVRFEAMYRLGWIEDYPFLNIALVDLVQTFQDQFAAARHKPPSLSKAHPLYPKYSAQLESDRPAFIRKLIPEVIKTFCATEDDLVT
jgi:hypothetical protein